MISECMEGHIDMIITKSISRFARNTLDCLRYIRQLKEKNIPVFFEKENINTMDSKGEVLLTIMASLAQQESESLSKNVKMGMQFRFQKGEVQVNHNRFMGYTKDEYGHLIIEPAEAEIVNRIYREYLQGASLKQIGDGLMADGILTGAGKPKWRPESVKKILKNEKYIGDALLQKTYTVDVLTKKRVKNEGIVPQYYVENNHPAIIEPELFDLVQSEIQRRGKGSSRYSGVTIFSSKVQCAECGGWYGSKVWHSNDKYRRGIYQCNNKFRHKTGCSTSHLTEFEIKDYFVKAVNQLIMEKAEILDNLQLIRTTLCDKADLIKQKEALEEEINVTVEMTQNIVAENARMAQNQDEYNKKYSSLVERYNKLKEEYDSICSTISDKDAKYEQIGRFIKVLKGQQELITEFDESLWSSLTEKIVVKSKEEVTVVFKDGTEITVE